VYSDRASDPVDLFDLEMASQVTLTLFTKCEFVCALHASVVQAMGQTDGRTDVEAESNAVFY